MYIILEWIHFYTRNFSLEIHYFKTTCRYEHYNHYKLIILYYIITVILNWCAAKH